MIITEEEAEKRLNWWIDRLHHFNGHSVVPPSADMVITTDASQSGWDATDHSVRTGVWTKREENTSI